MEQLSSYRGPRRRIDKFFKVLALVSAVRGSDITTTHYQEQVNRENTLRDHAFSLNELTPEEKIAGLIGTSAYSKSISENISKKASWTSDWLRTQVEAGLVHLYAGEMQSVEDAKETVLELRDENPAIIVSADIEGGWVNHLQLVEDDLAAFGFPEKLHQYRQEENTFYGNEAGSVLPSQEWLGRVYDSLETESEKKEFEALMFAYGAAIGRLCEHIGINLVLGPNLDIVKDIDGDTPNEKNDRSYGVTTETVTTLGLNYMKGVASINGVMPVAKHFIGGGLATKDPHQESVEVEIGKSSGAVLPFRDVINESIGFSKERIQLLQDQNKKLREKNLKYQADADAGINKRKNLKRVAANEALIAKGEAEIEILKENNQAGFDMGVLTATTTNTLYDKTTPTVFSKQTIEGGLRRPKSANGLGHEGLVMTDAMDMASAEIDTERVLVEHDMDVSPEALAIFRALAAGNDIALMRDLAGGEVEFAKEVASLIEEGVDLDSDGNADLTYEQVDEHLRRVLDLKVKFGLLTEEVINGDNYYVLDPRIYNPETSDVLMESFYSNQWPWIENEGTPEKPQPGTLSMLYKATKNFTLSLWRVNVQTVLPEYAGALDNEQPLIVVDKSARHMWIYSKTTGEILKEFAVAIGKGGLQERRFVGDHVTPTGIYEYVQSRNNDWWLENKGVEMPDEYGGKKGGMLVLAGQWHPEIAIHGTAFETDGEVSNGCVRLPNDNIEELLNEVPLGTFVVITN